MYTSCWRTFVSLHLVYRTSTVCLCFNDNINTDYCYIIGAENPPNTKYIVNTYGTEFEIESDWEQYPDSDTMDKL